MFGSSSDENSEEGEGSGKKKKTLSNDSEGSSDDSTDSEGERYHCMSSLTGFVTAPPWIDVKIGLNYTSRPSNLKCSTRHIKRGAQYVELEGGQIDTVVSIWYVDALLFRQ